MLPNMVSTALAVAALTAAGLWHGLGRRSFPGDRHALQANRRLASRGPVGLIYFGGLLSVGLLTEMTTPLVYGGVSFCLWAGPTVGALYGGGFALGRAVPAMIGVCQRAACPATAAAYPAVAFQRSARVVGIVVPSILLLVIVHLSFG